MPIGLGMGALAVGGTLAAGAGAKWLANKAEAYGWDGKGGRQADADKLKEQIGPTSAYNRAAREKRDSRAGLKKDYGGLVEAFEQGAEDTKAFTRSQAARSSAAALGGLGGMRGGAGVAGMAEAGQQAGLASASQYAQDKQRAAQAKVEGRQAEWEMGSDARDQAQATAGAETEIAGIMAQGQKFFDDDEEGMLRGIESTIQRVAAVNPQAAENLRQKYLVPGGEGYKKIHSWWD